MIFDDTWFIRRRHALIAPSRFGRPYAYATRGLVFARLDRTPEASTEAALAHLSPRHRTAVRQHVQLYRACLESLGLVPSHEIVHAAVQVEWLWYTTPFKRFYRDHLAHVMKVALIGHELLTSAESPLADPARPGDSPERLLIDRVAKGLSNRTFGTPALRLAARRAGVTEEQLADPRFWRAAVLDAVRIAGLLHDLAYPDDMAGKVASAAAPVRPRVPFEPSPFETARHAVAAMEDRLSMIPFSQGRLRDRLDPKDREAAEIAYSISHSPRAAYAMLRMQEGADRVARLSPFDAFVMEWAALGAMLHDLDKLVELRLDLERPDKEPKIRGEKRRLAEWMKDDANRKAVSPSFREDPVSYIVALADQLQDFGRMHYAAVFPGEKRRPSAPNDPAHTAFSAESSREERSFAVVRSCYPCQSVEVSATGPTEALEAHVTFDYLGASPFNASAKELSKARKYKDEQTALLFGAGRWLRSEGLLRSATLNVRVAEAP